MRILTLLLACGLIACEKKAEAPAPEAVSTIPKGPAPAPKQKARIVSTTPAANAPAPGSQPAAAGSQPAAAGSQPVKAAPAAGSQPAAGTAAAPGTPMPAGHPPVPNAPARIGGTIELSKDFAGDIKPNSVLFIIVRRDAGEGQRGMMLAAKKLPASAGMFPLKYMVTAADVMMQGTTLSGAVRVEARIDGDGDAISKNPGDLVGKALGAQAVGTVGVNFKLDQKL